MEVDHLFHVMATPKVSWDESDRHTLPTLSCIKKIKLSPPPLLPSKIRNNNNNNHNNINHRSSSDDRIDSVLSLPSLDLVGDLKQPVFRLTKRKFVVGDHSPLARLRFRHRMRSDPLDYVIQQPHPQRRPQTQSQCTTFSPCSSTAHSHQLLQRQRAVSYDQNGQPQPQQKKQKHWEEGTDEEEDELIELLQQQQVLRCDGHDQKPELSPHRSLED
jgi:hypothetical protein